MPRSVLNPVNERLKASLCSSHSTFRNLSSSFNLLNDSSLYVFSFALHRSKAHCKMSIRAWSKKGASVFKEYVGDSFWDKPIFNIQQNVDCITYLTTCENWEKIGLCFKCFNMTVQQLGSKGIWSHYESEWSMIFDKVTHSPLWKIIFLFAFLLHFQANFGTIQSKLSINTSPALSLNSKWLIRHWEK